MRIQCLYRDFFLFLKMMNLEKDHWRTFRRLYYDRHEEFLSSALRQCGDMTLKSLKKRITSIQKRHYQKLEALIKVYDIEDHTKEIVQRCKDLLHYQASCNLFIFVGFGGPASFVMQYKTKPVICIDLERVPGETGDFRYYPVLLSHLFCRYIQEVRTKEAAKTPLRRLISSGISVHFSRQAYPGYDDRIYLFLPEEARTWLDEHHEDVYSAVMKGGRDADLFAYGPKKKPGRAAPYLGYKIVGDYVRETGEQSTSLLIEQAERIEEAAVFTIR
ncbi:MAG: hypothetical protein JXQ30_07930 [Spirochaetes bacterium]|nr:hypothetical protein [Spirochaetota bacterium]